MLRTAFLNAMAGAYNQLAEYKVALGYANRLQTEAESYKLRFVAPYAQFARVNAYAGLGQYRRAEAVARQVVIDATETGDMYCVFNVRALRARIALATKCESEAIQLSNVPLDQVPLRALAAEFVTTHALALAVTGDCAGAEATLKREEADFLDGQVEALRRLAQTVVALRRNALQDSEVESLLLELNDAGCFDAFVFTYRAVPELLRRAANCAQWRPLVERITNSANDSARARAAGLAGTGSGNLFELSAREREVLELVMQGLRNREVGSRLFISEVTVKAHLRRIYAKLGVKSRTEAAIAAAELTRPDAEGDDGAA
jgi:ATP/maltotriose-dependent transcriptional regulator MalT